MFKHCGFLLLIFCGAAAMVVSAQDKPGGANPAVRVAVRLEGPSPANLEGLKVENFKVTQEKVAMTPSFFLNSESPLLITLVFDTTGDANFIDAIRKELVTFVNVLPPNVQLMIMTANDGLKVGQSNTADKAKLRAAILNYSVTGHPGYIENLLPMAENMNKLFMHNNIRVATIFITDSEIYKYRKPYTTSDFNTEVDQVKEKLKEVAAPIYTLRLPIGNNDTFNRNYEGAMREMMKITGGDAEFPLSVSGVSSAFVTILHKIHFTYVLGYDPPDAKPGKEYRLKVEMVGVDAKPEYRKSYRLPK